MLAQFLYSKRRRMRLRVFLFFSFFLFAAILTSSSSAQPGGGRGKSSFTARLVNLESVVKDPFRFTVSLHNGNAAAQRYALIARTPDGWTTIFRAGGSQVAAIRIDSGKTQEISVEVIASPIAKPGMYNIPMSAISNGDSLHLELEAVVKGGYSLELSTPSGRLSDDITEGNNKPIRLTLKNTGTLPLDDLELSAQSPTQWSATFEPSKIKRLDAGQTQELSATLSVPDKTIAGDYITTFTARNSHTTASAAFRMTVKTSLLAGWIGILVILLALGIVYYLIRKYGRR